MSWNIRHFRGDPQRADTVASMIRAVDPDVFAIIEFEAKEVALSFVADGFDDYDFGLTDSRQQIEFLVGWRRGRFDQVLYTQRREFQAGNQFLRPGGLLSFTEPGDPAFYNALFLHTDSGKTVDDYDNRQEMFDRTWGLRGALATKHTQNGQPRLIVMGDLNTMGRSRTNTLPTIRAVDEVAQLEADAAANGMRALQKSSPLTYRSAGGSLRGELDHALISTDLNVQQFNDPVQQINPFEVEVSGWNLLPEPDRTDFITTISDHCALVVETL